MSDEADAPKRRWFPQTVRVRLTIVATLAFAVTISLAAFGLVRLVHNNLVDRIEETNQQQLDYLQSQVASGALDPKPQSFCVYQAGRLLGYVFATGDAGQSEVVVIRFGSVFGWLLLAGLGNVIIWSLVNVFVAFLYNLISDVVGGIEVTLAQKR